MEGARPARPDDVARLAELNRQALDDIVSSRGGAMFTAREARAEPLAEAFATAVDDSSQLVLAGTIDDVVVGYAIGRVETLRTGERLGVIDDLFVEAGARGVGIGECLIAELLRWFREQQCAACDAYALPGDRSTKNFFESSGFTARLLVMHHRLP